jgi:hypothetical protein
MDTNILVRTSYFLIVSLLFALCLALCCVLINCYISFNLFIVCLFSCLYVLVPIFFCILCSCIVLCIVSPHVCSCLFSICVQFYQPLPLGGNQLAVNKYHHHYHQHTASILRVAWNCVSHPSVCIQNTSV